MSSTRLPLRPLLALGLLAAASALVATTFGAAPAAARGIDLLRPVEAPAPIDVDGDHPNADFDPDLAEAAGTAALLQGPPADTLPGEAPPEILTVEPGGLQSLAAGTSIITDPGGFEIVESRDYNQVRQKSAHNSFQKQEAILDQLVYHRVRSLEFDLHNDKGFWWAERSGDWYVYHAIADPDTTCHRFSDCLDELAAFHRANPNHEVVTVFLDIKDAWNSGNQPADLDWRIAQHLPTSALYRPGDMMAGCSGSPDLQAAAETCGWPALSSLRGQFIFVLTGDSSKLDAYALVNGTLASRSAFIAPGIGSFLDIYARSHAVFFNLSSSVRSLGDDIEAAGFVSRVYKVNSDFDWWMAEGYRIHHLATDKINYHQDPWARTHNTAGWPFECFDACSDTRQEGVRVLAVKVDSEDIWGSSDHFRFLYEYTSVNGNFWTTAVNTRNSHVEEWAKGCLMARESTSKYSPYFATCRPYDDHVMRIQWRTGYAGGSDRKDASFQPGDTIDKESLTFIGLYVYNNNTCAAGYGSQDGSIYSLIGYKCYGGPLNRQGLASSSHGGGFLKFLYTNVSKNGAAYTLGTFPYGASIGTVRSWQAFDGVSR